MARRCPECYAELPEDAVWVCPTCKYTLRTPAAAKAGIIFMVVGLALLGAFVYGPDQIGLRSGFVPGADGGADRTLGYTGAPAADGLSE